MAFNGSARFAKQDLIRVHGVDRHAPGPGVNANTSFDQTVYVLHVPTDNPEALRKAFMFFADVATGLSFDPEAIDKERGVIIEEWRQGRGADGADAGRADARCCSRARATPSARRSARGESIERFKPEALKRFYTDWYRPDLMAVIAVGDFDKASVERMIRDEFGSIPVPRSAPAAARRSRCRITPRRCFAIASDPEATDHDGRRSTTCCRCGSRSRSAPTGSARSSGSTPA